MKQPEIDLANYVKNDGMWAEPEHSETRANWSAPHAKPEFSAQPEVPSRLKMLPCVETDALQASLPYDERLLLSPDGYVYRVHKDLHDQFIRMQAAVDQAQKQAWYNEQAVRAQLLQQIAGMPGNYQQQV